MYWIPVSYPLLSGIIQTTHHLSFCGPGSGLAVSRLWDSESLSQSVGMDCSLLTRLDTHLDIQIPVGDFGFCEAPRRMFPCFLAEGTSVEDGVVYVCDCWLDQRD